jgi:predicted ribosome-associated RNA-binding protein Tma20
MKRKFKIFYPETHANPEKAGLKYKPPHGHMLVMNNDGVFFLYDSEPYYPSISLLSDVIGHYDVVWNDDGAKR